jgi:hypothetical protein
MQPSLQVKPESIKLVNRYKDGYRVAGVIVGVGGFVKILGIVLGLMGGFMVFAISYTFLRFNSDSELAGLTLAAVIGGMFWLVPYVLGTLVSAHGQILKASLDGAVNTSPFLNNSQRAEIMSLVREPDSYYPTMPQMPPLPPS